MANRFVGKRIARSRHDVIGPAPDMSRVLAAIETAEIALGWWKATCPLPSWPVTAQGGIPARFSTIVRIEKPADSHCPCDRNEQPRPV